MGMNNKISNLPPEQQAIRDKCFHPTGTFVEFPIKEIEQSISDRFEKIVQLYPDRLAVNMGDRALTYEQLNQAANRIARRILDWQGPGQEPVVVLFEQGIEAIAAILGVLKAGKFYVPVSPSLPSARIAAVLHDAEAGLLVTDDKSLWAAGNLAKNVLIIDEINSTVSNENLSLSVSSDDLAYIIYTSGSTGKPKGVFQKQRNVLQWMLLHTNTLHISPADRLSLTHSHTTSGGIYNLFGALLNGAALFPFDFRTDGEQLASWLRDESITIYHSGPLVFRQWADTLTGADEFPALRLIRLSGMAMAKEDIARYRRHFHQNCLLVHVLGSSEAGTIPHYFIDKHSNVPESPLPVGYSVGDSEVFVLDESGRRAEPEVVGEIAVRSRYLICGYWRNAALTSEKFLPDPTGGEARLYLTGDSGRMAADGCLYHLGRKDFRVKIRGYSVEIGEIESALREHPAINEVVVIAAADAKGEPQLIAYIVSSTGVGVTVSALREHLLGRLPEYMVPSCFVVLPAMPLTPNGKIDRNALPAPPRTRPPQEAPYVAPRNPLEQDLKKIWSEVLCLDEIGIHDNFFDLGGHSLRAVQVLTRIKQVSRVAIPLQQFFASPTLAGLANYVEQPRSESARASIVPLDRVAREPELPLSFAQQRLWFLDQLEPGSPRYNVAIVLQITGRLDVQILQRTLDEILKRHESLRTVFAVNDGQPCQNILPVVTIQLPTVDLTEIASQANRSLAIEQLTVEEAHRSFDLACGPLMRCRLLLLDQMQHVLILTLHHITFDGWSAAILMRELAVLYEAFSAGKAPPLPELRIQYADFAAWQAASLRKPGAAELLAYWKKQLANLSPLRLPTDRPRRTVPSCRGARKWFSLSPTTTQALTALSRQENATLFMLLLTSFQTLLHRYTGQTDIVTGTPVAGRPHPELEKLIGFFLNMLVLRVDLSGDPTLREALARTRETCLDAYAHEELPFEILVKELKAERTLDQNPLFQVSFVLQNFPKASIEATDMTVVEVDIDPGIARFDLHVFMTEEKDRLKGYFEYNTDLFDAATIERMVAHFQTLLEGIVANPEQRISDLPPVSNTERQQLLVEFNETETDDPKDKELSISSRNTLRLPPEQQAIRDKCFHPTGTFVEFPIEDVETSIPERFEKVVQLYPERLAITMGDRSLTYDELNRYANRVARAILDKRGARSEPIALLFDHGIDAIVAIFGTLKAGKFYFALDPLFPAERIAYMLEDSQAGLIVTNNRNVGLARQLTNEFRAVLNTDEIDGSLPCENVGLAVSPNDLAAILYTSGSTGKPKAVVQNHRNHLCSVMVNSNEVHISFHDRLTLLHSVSFGSSRGHLFQALLNGAALFPYDIKSEGVHRLASWLDAEQITVFHSPPAVFRQLAELLPGQAKLSSLRLIRLSGAPITQRDFDLYKKNFSLSTLLEIHLGSTETRAICFAVVDHTFAFPKQGFPVGYACPGNKVFLLNGDGHEVEPGEVGEIAIKGPNLNPTYWRRPELTSEEFLPTPNGADERIYLTGDLGRMLPDGFLIHLGRKDLTVKIRGYRVETSEIEKALLAHPRVRDAGVVAWDREPGDKYLTAYIVAHENPPPTITELSSFLRTSLPDFMVPTTFVFMQSLPLTNGKLNRSELPPPGRERPQMSQPYIPARNAPEQKLVQIWEELMGISHIGIKDNFFDLGGHSLLASRFVSRVDDAFHVELPLRTVFEFPTVAALVERIEECLDKKPISTIPPNPPVSRGDKVPLSFSQRGLWFLDQLDPRSCRYNLVPVYQLVGPLDVTALEKSINEIIKRHEVLRTVFKANDGQTVQVVLPALTIKISIVDIRWAASEEARQAEIHRRYRDEAHRAFDLAHGPLLRVTLLRLAEDENVLLLAIHHMIFDGWSRGILARELSAFYAGLIGGNPFPLRELSTQYVDFALAQERWLQGENLQAQLLFWKRQLENVPMLQLPTDRPRPAVQSSNGARQRLMISETLCLGLKNLGERHGATLFMTLLAAYQTLLHHYSGQTDVVIGFPVAGRNHKELENLIGFFLNMLVLRTNLSGNPSFREVLTRVREGCLAALAHQDLPFEKLVEELHPRPDLSHYPLFQVTFSFQNTPKIPLQLFDLAVNELDLDTGIARFDLNLFMEEEAGRLKGYWDYNTALFDATTIERMASRFQILLDEIVADPERRISDLPLLSPAERHQLLTEWNNTMGEASKDQCIHELFETQVEKSPDALAVVFEDQQLTYRELNRRANQLALYLGKLGVGPESLAGICMEPSLETIVGLLGILKAGGAYVPLDPAYPKERLAFMLEDSRVAVLLTQKELLGRLGEIQNRIVICLDRDWQEIAQQSDGNPGTEVTADNLAYVIYTSGSTGRPKGVLVSHHNVVRLFKSTHSWFQFDQNDVWTLFHSYAFDFSVWEMWGALLHGGQLVVVPYWASRSPKEFYELLRANRVTVLNQTPSAFRQLIAIDENSKASDNLALRLVIFGGEALELQSLKPWFDRHGDQKPRLINMYGITEATVHATYRPITAADVGKDMGSPVGKRLPDLELYILDQHRNLLPIGVPGELHIGGAGVARGYLDRPELTAEKFVAYPFINEPGARLFRTGDLARYLADGNIEFLGRIDDQVKIRGFRVELGEIQSVLSQHPAVREAVVIACEAPSGAPEDPESNRRLVAYAVPNPEKTITVGDLRSFLKKELPDYMVPSAFVLLAALPLTPNGKVDRCRLPSPDDNRSALGEVFVPPRTLTEEIIAGIWAEILGIKQVGIHDNFFDLGGHSLMATQVLSRLNRAFQADVSLRMLFETPTVEGLALAITEVLNEADVLKILAEVESQSEEEARRHLAEQDK